MLRMCDFSVTQAFQFSSDGIHSLVDKRERKSYSLAKQHTPLYYSNLYRLLEKCSIFGIAFLRIKSGQTSPHHSKKESGSYTAGQEAKVEEAKGKVSEWARAGRNPEVSCGHVLTSEALSGHRHNFLCQQMILHKTSLALSQCILFFVSLDLTFLCHYQQHHCY